MTHRIATALSLVTLLAATGCSEHGFQTADDVGQLSLAGLELGGGEVGEGEYALESYIVTVEAIELAAASDDEGWEILLEDGGWNVDLLGAEVESGFTSSLPVGEYPYVFLKLSGQMAYQRSAAGSLCAVNVMGEAGGEGVASVLSTPDLLASEFGQEVDESSFTVLVEPDVRPGDVHKGANDDYFWVMAEAVVIDEGETTELFLAAMPDSVEAGGACDDAPGKPFFLLGDASDLLGAYGR